MSLKIQESDNLLVIYFLKMSLSSNFPPVHSVGSDAQTNTVPRAAQNQNDEGLHLTLLSCSQK